MYPEYSKHLYCLKDPFIPSTTPGENNGLSHLHLYGQFSIEYTQHNTTFIP